MGTSQSTEFFKSELTEFVVLQVFPYSVVLRLAVPYGGFLLTLNYQSGSSSDLPARLIFAGEGEELSVKSRVQELRGRRQICEKIGQVRRGDVSSLVESQLLGRETRFETRSPSLHDEYR